MTKKFGPTTYLRVTILLAVAAFQSCISAIPIDFPVINSPSLKLASSFEPKGVKTTRNLRVRVLAAIDEVEDGSDERVNLGASTVTKFKDLSNSATQKLEKMAASAKLKVTSNNQQTTDKRFARYKVDTVKSKLLESAEFQKWYKVVNNAYKKTPEEGDVAMVRKLTNQYGDEDLTKFLVEGEKNIRTMTVADKLQKAQRTNWSADKKSVDDVFKLLKLDEPGENVFKNPLFDSWVQYANSIETNADKVMFLALKANFGDEALAKMWIASKKNSSIARQIEQLQLDHWYSSGKTSDEIFELLKLNDEIGNLLQSPTFYTWVSFVMKSNKQSPYDTIFAKLSTRYSEENLAELIAAAKHDSVRSFAEKLEAVQLKVWLSKGKSPDDVFKLLSLHKEEGVDLLASDMLRVWSAYVERLNKNPDKLLLNKLKLRNSDEELAQFLLMARKDARLMTITDRLEEMMQKNWIDEGKSAQDVFKLYKLDEAGDSVFTNQMWSTWNSYVTKLNRGDPDESIYLVLKNHFGEKKLKTMMSMATKPIADKLQQGGWLSEGKTADDIYKLLKFDQDGDKFIESPMVSIWVSYVKKIEKLKENPNEFAVILYLEQKFDDKDLARIISVEKQKNASATKEVTSELQQLQFKRWMRKGMDPARVGKLLATEEDIRNTRVTLDFYYF
ncbi:RxLR effector protein, partial [Phytophthora megakarya]